MRGCTHRDSDIPDDEDSQSYPQEALSSPHDQEPIINQQR